MDETVEESIEKQPTPPPVVPATASTAPTPAAAQEPDVDTEDPSGLRPSGSIPETGKGGIDFRALPIVTQPMVLQGQAGTVPLINAANINIDKEWQDIERVVNAGIIPSIEPIKEYLILSCKSPDCQDKINQALSGIADILRLEEERSASTEVGLKEILTLLESNKSAEQLSAALLKIVIASQEPMKI